LALIQLKKGYPVFRTTTANHSLDTQLKRLHLEDGDHKVTLLGNFGVTEQSINPAFQQTGSWHEFFSGEELQVSNTSDPIMLQPGEYRLYSTERLYLDFLSLQNLTVSGTIDTCFAAKQNITVAGEGTSFVVENGSAATIVAGESIHFHSYMHVEPGAYFRAYIDEGGNFCASETTMLTVKAEYLYDKETPVATYGDQSFFETYPNPTSGLLTLEFTDPALAPDAIITVYNIMGEQLVFIRSQGEKRINIHLVEMPAGTYLIRAISGEISGYEKIIKR